MVFGVIAHFACASAQSLQDEYAPKLNGDVFALETDAAGRTLVGGSFTTANNLSAIRLVRLFGDGGTDESFQASADNVVRTILPLNDQVVVGGAFTEINGQTRTRLAVLDDSGNPIVGTNPTLNGDAHALVKNINDDSYFVGGAFTQVNGQSRSRIARMNGGNVLSIFVPPAATGTVRALAVQSDGKLLVTGSINRTGAPTSEGPVFRLNPDGSHDPSFSFESAGVNDTGYHISILENGEIIVAGEFSQGNILRLNPDGSIDGGFVPPNVNGMIRDVAPQPDGRLAIGGDFTGLSLRDRIARLHENGALDGTFAPLLSPNGTVHSLAISHNGGVLVGGDFTEITGLARSRVARIGYRGGLDGRFEAAFTGGDVEVMAAQPDGKIYVGGSFTHVNGALKPYVVRLNNNGSVDGSFNVTPNNDVRAIAVLPDHVLLAGAFNAINGTSRLRIAKLTSGGALLSGFNPSVENGTLQTMALQEDGKILIGGSFTAINGVTRHAIARLNADGSLDSGFAPAPLSDFTRVRAISVRADDVFMSPAGLIYVGGETNGTNRLERLNANGSLDSSFVRVNTSTLYSMRTTGFGTIDYGARTGNGTCSNFLSTNLGFPIVCLTSLDEPALSFVRTVGNEYFVGGAFAEVNGISHPGLIKLIRASANPEILSDAFDFPISGGSATVNSILLQDDGKLLFAGNFTSAGGTTVSNIARSSEGFAEGPNTAPLSKTSGIRAEWDFEPAIARFVPGALTPQIERAPTLLISNTCCDDATFTSAQGARASMENLSILSWEKTDFNPPSNPFYLRWRYQATDARGGTSLHETPILRVIPRSPILTFNPAPNPNTNTLIFPNGPAGSANAIITVTPSEGTGGITSLGGCMIENNIGPGTFSNPTFAPSNLGWMFESGHLSLNCIRAALVTTATLRCVQTYSDGRLGLNRRWGLTCPAASSVVDSIFASGFE